MKLKIKVGELLAAVEKATLTVDKKGKTAVNLIYLFANTAAQALYIFSTNMNSESTQKLACEVETEGQILVNPEVLIGGLSRRDPALEAAIEMVDSKKEGNRLRIKAGKTGIIYCQIDVTAVDVMAKKMNSVPFKNDPAYQVDGSNLNEFVKRAMFCIPKGDNGQTKVQMGGLKLFSNDLGSIGLATNGKAAAKIVIKGEKSKSPLANMIIPQESLPSLNALAKKSGDIDVIEGQKNGNGEVSKLYFHMGDVFFGTTLLAGKYPDLDKAFKEHAPDFWFTLDRQELINALERTPKFADEHHIVQLELAGDIIVLCSGSKDAGNEIQDSLTIGRDDIPEDRVALPAEISLKLFANMDQLFNIATCEKSERMLLGVSKHHGKALVVYEDNDDIESTYALMPVRP